jgi:hypothetical protein
MKRKLKKYFQEKKDDLISVGDIQRICAYMNVKDMCVINVNDLSLVIHHDYVEIGATDGEWFHQVMYRSDTGVSITPGMKDYLFESLEDWHGDIIDLYERGLTLPHPLVVGA